MKQFIIIALFTVLVGAAVAQTPECPGHPGCFSSSGVPLFPVKSCAESRACGRIFSHDISTIDTQDLHDAVMREWAVEWLKIELRDLTEADRAEIRARRTP